MSRLTPRGISWLVLVFAGVFLAAGAAAETSGRSEPTMRGRPLVEVLYELQQRGLEVVFSTAVVDEDLRVGTEPATQDPREILEEILPPLGLRAREGPEGTVLILRAEPAPGSLSGRVVRAADGEPIQGAVVRIEPTKAEARTGRRGLFELRDLAAGSYTVRVDAAGYAPALFEGAQVLPGRTLELRVELDARSRLVTEVRVTPAYHSLVSEEAATRLTLEAEEVELVPSVGGDVGRVVGLLPGVAAPDNSAAFNVRGSAARDVALVLDGFELYAPFHLEAFQSPFSLVDTQVVDRIDFFGGGFTVDRGDRHGAFVEIKTLRADTEERGELQVGSLNSRFAYRAPLPEGGGSWLLSGRAWYPEALLDTTELGHHEGLDPRFADLYGKAVFDLSPRHRLSAHTLLAWDRLRFEEIEDGVTEGVEATSETGYGWLRWISGWSESLASETLVSAGRIERSRRGRAAEDDPLTVDDERSVEFFGLEHDSVWHISEDQALKAGFGLRRLLAGYRYSMEVPADPSLSRRIRLDPDGTSLAVYLAHRARVLPEVVLEVGLRWDRQTHTDDNQLSPRMHAVWSPGPRWEARLSVGRFQQSQRIHELQVEDGERRFHTAESSRQVDLSLERSFPSGHRLRLAAYQHDLSHLRPRWENLFEPIELFPETTADRVRIDPEGARLRGIEISARSPRDRPWFWWGSYTVSSAEDIVDGERVARSWDQSHALRFLVGYRREERWSLSLAGAVHTGWPTTPVSAEKGSDGPDDFEVIPGPRNTDRFPTYARFDLKARRSFPCPRGRLWLDLEVLNVTDRDNPCCLDEVFFKERPSGAIDTRRAFGYWLGTSASLSLRWEF